MILVDKQGKERERELGMWSRDRGEQTDTFMGDLSLSASGLWRIAYADGMIHPEARYRYGDAIEPALGGFWFEGDDPFELFGRFNDKDLLYTEARFRF